MSETTRAPAELDNNLISLSARKVIRRLNEEGFEAYLVGGGVRDLLLGRTPKDFDVATNATPDDVLELFRNARAIGRRFRIVHVRFGREVIEVATFRATALPEQADSGRILSDNEYGTLEQDVLRRDFTVNALYYDPEEGLVLDAVGGLDDLKQGTLRLLGDPENRYREDPVRMLRAVRFAAKLGFDIHPETASPIRVMAHLIKDIPPARLFEETLKLLMNGSGEACFKQFREFGLFEWMFPDSYRCASDPVALKLIELALASTDRRLAEARSVTPAFIFSAMLWPAYIEAKAALEEQGSTTYDALHEAAQQVLSRQQAFTSIPKRFTGMMSDIWQMQFRLPNRHGKRALVIVEHRRFRAAYDFLLLREGTGEDLGGLGEWWTEYQDATPEDRVEMAEAVTRPATKKRARRKRKRTAPRTDARPD